MSIESGNHTANSKWHLVHDIRAAVRSMDGVARENTLLRIKARLLQDEIPNPEILQYVTALLGGKEPKGICHREVTNGQ